MIPDLTPGLALAIMLGGALGALVRYGAQLLWPARGSRVPLAVLMVNVVGSAMAGAFLALAQWVGADGSPVIASSVALIVMTGFCGGLTTFSTFAAETVELAMNGAWRPAAVNIVLTLVLGLGAATLVFVVTNGLLISTSRAFVG